MVLFEVPSELVLCEVQEKVYSLRYRNTCVIRDPIRTCVIKVLDEIVLF